MLRNTSEHLLVGELLERFERVALVLDRASSNLSHKPTKTWLRHAEAAEHYGLSSDVLHKLVHSEGLPRHKIGPKSYRYCVEEIDEWLSNR